MAENTFQVTISTPDGIVYDGNATMLVMTTTGGQLGLMANALLIKHQDSDKEDERVAVNGGFIEFHGNVATIAASSAELPEDIDVARAQSAKERSEALIKKAREAKDADALDRAEVHLRRAINRLHLSGK